MLVTLMKRAVDGVLYLVLGAVTSSEIEGVRILVNRTSQPIDRVIEHENLAQKIARRRRQQQQLSEPPAKVAAGTHVQIPDAIASPTLDKIEC